MNLSKRLMTYPRTEQALERRALRTLRQLANNNYPDDFIVLLDLNARGCVTLCSEPYFKATLTDTGKQALKDWEEQNEARI